MFVGILRRNIMKIRYGFVSNSSSSSFSIIDESLNNLIAFDCSGQTLTIGPSGGHTKFGWEPRNFTNVWDRINFACLQALYVSKHMDMFRKVITEYSKCSELDIKLTTEYDCKRSEVHGYIDHQSSGEEGRNLGMFDSEDTLKRFLFGKDSFIHTDNDNH
jgi:hypothetical protein